MMPGAIMGPLLDDKPETLFDPTKVHLSRHRQQRHARLRDAQGFQDQDLRGRAQQNKTSFGGVAAGDAPATMPICTITPPARKFEVVAGYKGTVDIALAMERGEVDGVCGWDWSSVKSQKPDWVRDKKAQRAGAGGARAERRS